MGVLGGYVYRTASESNELDFLDQYWQWFLLNWYFIIPPAYIPIGILVARGSYLFDKHIMKETNPEYTGGGVTALVLLWPLAFIILSVVSLGMFIYLASLPGLKVILSFVRS